MAEIQCVIDTAPLVAWVADLESVLGKRARRLIHKIWRSGGRIAVPTICLFEVAQLEERRKLKLRLPFDEWCALAASTPPLQICGLDREHVSEARALPTLRDPFDRLIAGTAVALGVPLVTSDERITVSGRVGVVW